MNKKKKSLIGWADSEYWLKQFGFRGNKKKERLDGLIKEPFLATPTIYRYRKTKFFSVNPFPYSDGQQKIRITIEEM